MGTFPYSPGMVPCGGGGSPSGLIEKYLGEAYAKILLCADNMPQIQELVTNLAEIVAVGHAIENGADFTAMNWGEILGTITAQTDLVNYITSRLTNYQTTNPILTAFSGLTLTGNSGRTLQVKIDETGLIWAVPSGGTGGGLTTGNYGDIIVNSDGTMSIANTGGTTLASQLALKVNVSAVGAAGGVAPLDGTGKIAAAFLPSYVDDVIEAANFGTLPAGETGKIYVTLDTNKTYRWSGSAFVEISASPGSTDAVTEGATNLYFTNTRAQAALAASLAGKADLSGGKLAAGQIPATVVQYEQSDGLNGIEAGQYIDFHTSADGVDYQGRIQASSSGYLDITTRGGLLTISSSDLILNTNGKALKFLGSAGGYAQILAQSDGNWAFWSTHVDLTPRPVFTIAMHSDTSVLNIYPDVSMAGNLVVTGEITSPSDERLKSEITPILDASRLIAQLGGFRFLMDGREQIGVIAQQVMRVFPEIVHCEADGRLSVNYAKLVAPLIADNNALRSKVDGMERRLLSLEER